MPKKEKIRDMFDSIAPGYDAFNHLASLNIDRSWRRKAIRAVSGINPSAVLDVACGTGDSTIALARALSPECRITGVDISSEMLKVMEGKVASEGLSDRISAETGDAENLGFPDGSFDAVTCAFGVRNFEDMEKGIREMLRVLRPGGKLVILELSMPSGRILRKLYEVYFLHILPLLGKKISGNAQAFRYLPSSVVNFPGKEEFTAILKNCGCKEISHRALSFGLARLYTATGSVSE